jgi:hypothetical protein
MDEFRRWPRQAVSSEVRGSRHARFAMLPIIGKCIGRGDGVRACRMLSRIGAARCDPSDARAQLDAVRVLIVHLGIDEPERVVRRLEAMCDALKIAVSAPDGADASE